MCITILDGGMGQEITRRAGETTSLWSVKSLLENPDLVGEVPAAQTPKARETQCPEHQNQTVYRQSLLARTRQISLAR